jgi:drug/metabolite transporter (DMT)-like permease
MQKMAADRLPKLGLSLRQGEVYVAFLRSRLWRLGILTTVIGWICFLKALANAPVSIVQPALGAGLVLLAIISIFYLGEEVRVAEWIGIILMVSGIILLGVSGSGDAARSGALSLGGLAIVTIVSLALVAACVPLARSRLSFSTPLVLGFAAGMLIGLAALYTKGLFLSLESGLPLLAWAVFLPLMLAGNIVGLWVEQAGFQQGRALIVVAMNAVTNKVVTIVGGMATLGEILPDHPKLAAARVAGFVAILAGTALLARFGSEIVAERAAPSVKPVAAV